eukprot:scaffold122482_cov27-Phaeocystis_antarctica.AAC.1
MALDCKFICDHAWWAKSWCAAHEFSTEDNGSCKLSSCMRTPSSSPPSLAPLIDWADADEDP